AANAGLRGMDVAEVVRAVDDPEFLVAGREIKNLLFVGQNDERREAQLRLNRNDVVLAVVHNASRVGRGERSDLGGAQRDEDNCAGDCENTAPRTGGYAFHL